MATKYIHWSAIHTGLNIPPADLSRFVFVSLFSAIRGGSTRALAEKNDCFWGCVIWDLLNAENQMKANKNCKGDIRYSFRDTSRKMRMIYALNVGDYTGQ